MFLILLLYSIGVAAPVNKLLEGMKFDTVILIGPCHRTRFTGVSPGRFSAYRTPLGLVPADIESRRRVASALIDNQLCGALAVTTLLLILESLSASHPMLLKYANSGDLPLIGDTSRVVRYASFALFK